jgi:hypothetical protein
MDTSAGGQGGGEGPRGAAAPGGRVKGAAKWTENEYLKQDKTHFAINKF